MRRLIYIFAFFIIFSLTSVASYALSSEYSNLSTLDGRITLEPDVATATPRTVATIPVSTFKSTPISNTGVVGCPEANYPAWETSPYVLPYSVGETYEVRLSNCSSSFHAEGRNDELAFDFVMDIGTLVTASRGGTVVYVEESGQGRELNNVVVVDHGDNTFGEYMHLKFKGALVEVGDVVEQGDAIGLSGATGLAGYPHLHFIVVHEAWEWPYQGVPVTFSNTTPNPHSLASDTTYTALPYTD